MNPFHGQGMVSLQVHRLAVCISVPFPICSSAAGRAAVDKSSVTVDRTGLPIPSMDMRNPLSPVLYDTLLQIQTTALYSS